jgi:uncharacterized protein (TIGR00369 family)
MDFEHYDEELAAGMLAGGFDARSSGGGLPAWIGIRTVDVGPGFAVSEAEIRAEMLNPFGAAHGGVLAAMVDHMLGTAVFPVVPRGTWPATLEYKLNYLAPGRQGILRCRGEVVALRRTTAVVRVDADNDGKAVGAGLGTVSLQAPKR